MSWVTPPSQSNADTIAAIATAPGRGGIGVVRVSGPQAPSIAQALIGKLPPPRLATLANFLDTDASVIDQGIALYFAAPHSFTGEDVLELQGHGGPAVMQRLLARCLEAGARIAEPGEFTRRAYLNDKLDLAQAESVADLIDASSVQAAKSAMRSLQGEFSREIHALVQSLIDLRMLVEATLDFPEEEIDFLDAAHAKEKLAAIREQLGRVLTRAKLGALLREGLQVVLIGQPNVGKSSLLNRLAGEEVAIVTPVAGTTRDTVREEIQIDGIPLHIIDTAGLRETQDEVEKIGIARTWAVVDKAQLALVIIDAARGQAEEDEAILRKLPSGLPVLRVYNKIDLVGETPHAARDGEAVYLSAKTGAGLEILHDRLLQLAGWQAAEEGVYLARERHLQALYAAKSSLENAEQNWQQLELLAEELKLAQNALASITGEFSADDLLGEIFSRFCIGK
ncbi:MAG: tRNA uridine-5-carboxymethylaminomethyl(34) synthesis GTPase MnmE [Betaproteobacteria bacterium RBG_16_58_11]|nr:MAG: tRNA uridine-5-carboxymethylaminomethyl(34) synthesis GTPase MnmE [Betaproteobacteria bacterium RBG_16_58_11]OFZ97592.1 MAG: tRNA uridine-5-carboxymethylaminomethyl(34) synthesis GTPase MnmE [Betaproteobacteria bacterium RBG_19FT_COMBO_58_11]